MTALSRLTQTATGREATYGVPAAPAISIPFTSLNVSEAVSEGDDAGWRSAPVDQVGVVPVGLASTVDIAGPVLADSIGVVLSGLLGDTVFTAGAPNTWALALHNSVQPASHTLTTLDPVGGLQRPGVRWRSCDLTWDPSQLLTYTAQADGLPATAWTGTVPTTTETPFPGWACTAQVGGVTDVTVLSARVRLARKVAAKRNTDGTLTPWLQRAATLAVSGELRWLCLSDSYRQDAVNGTLLALDLTWTQGSAGALRSLELHCTQTVLTSAARDVGGKYVRLVSQWRAVANSTDKGASGGFSPVKVTIKNTVGSGGY